GVPLPVWPQRPTSTTEYQDNITAEEVAEAFARLKEFTRAEPALSQHWEKIHRWLPDTTRDELEKMLQSYHRALDEANETNPVMVDQASAADTFEKKIAVLAAAMNVSVAHDAFRNALLEVSKQADRMPTTTAY